MDNTNTDNLIEDKLIRMQLANIRKSKRKTQKQMAIESGISESCISNIESGSSNSPTLRSLIKYANSLGVKIYISKKDEKYFCRVVDNTTLHE